MNRPFFLFTGDHYYPAGGWDDYRGRFATENEALTAAANQKDDWWQVVNINSGQIVAQSPR